LEEEDDVENGDDEAEVEDETEAAELADEDDEEGDEDDEEEDDDDDEDDEVDAALPIHEPPPVLAHDPAMAIAEDDDAEQNGVPEAPDPGARRRYRFKHPTASGKTIAAAGFVEAARTTGVLILTHRRLLVNQFTRDLTDEGYGGRLHEPVMLGQPTPRGMPLTINTYAWFIKH